MSATITGSAKDLGAAWAVNSTINFTSAAPNNIAGGSLVNSAVPKTAKVKADGTFSCVLPTGNYYVTFEAGSDRWLINVPDDNASYDIVGRIVPAVITPTNPISVPNASSGTAGLVKAIKDSTGTPKVPTGIYFPDDVAALKALPTDAGNTYATLINRQSGEPKYFKWDNTSSAADDTTGFTVVKPSDLPANGRWIQDS